MFCVLYFGNECDINVLKKNVIQILNDCEYTETNEEFRIWCEGYSLSIEEGGHGVLFASEDYGMEFKFQFWFEIYHSYTDWAIDLMVFIGKLLNSMNGDCVIELNDKPILMRKGNVIVVDDKKLSGTVRFPFHGLGLLYQEGNLERL